MVCLVIQVVVLPTSVIQPPEGLVGPGPLAIVFAAATLIATLGANGVPFLGALLAGDSINASTLTAAIPGTAMLFAILGALSVSLARARSNPGMQ
jgi:hypothetical protein